MSEIFTIHISFRQLCFTSDTRRIIFISSKPRQTDFFFFFSSNGYCRNNFSQTVSYYTSTSSVNPRLLSEYTKIILYFLCRLSQDSSAYSSLSFKKKKKSLRVLSDCVTRLRVGGCPPPPPSSKFIIVLRLAHCMTEYALCKFSILILYQEIIVMTIGQIIWN